MYKSELLTVKEAMSYLRRNRKDFWLTVIQNDIPYVKEEILETVKGEEKIKLRYTFYKDDLDSYLKSKLHTRKAV